MRIVSLLPSATEIVYALGLGDQLAGVTDECEIPAWVDEPPPVVVRAKQPPGLSAGEIDEWVRKHAAAGGLYVLDDDALARISPDLVLTQDLCRVCAVPTGDVDAALARLAAPAHVVTLEPTRLGEVVQSLQTVADAALAPEAGRRLRAELTSRLHRVARAVEGLTAVPTLVLEWLDPPFTAGHWVPDVVTAAGGSALLGSPGGRSRSVDWDTVRTVSPEVLVLAPCGMEPAQTWEQAELVPADVLASAARTVALDLARPGPALVDRVEALAAVLHPDADLPPRPEVAVSRPVTAVPRPVIAG